MPFHLLRRENS